MYWSDLPLSPSPRLLRQFAALALVFLGGLAAWQGCARDDLEGGLALAGAGALVGTVGLVRPRWLRWPFVVWTAAAFPVGWVMSRVLLAAVFFGLFWPLGLVLRLLGRDPLALRPRPYAVSYWAPKPAPTDPRRYLRQF
jgi:hypothetical protein